MSKLHLLPLRISSVLHLPIFAVLNSPFSCFSVASSSPAPNPVCAWYSFAAYMPLLFK